MIFKVFNSKTGSIDASNGGHMRKLSRFECHGSMSGKHSGCHGHNQPFDSDGQKENMYLEFVSSH